MQQNDWTYQFINATTFILGNKKNAGKTTFMNLVLNKVRKVVSPAFCSTGIDGENSDLIDGRKKPSIVSCTGDYIVSTFPMINKSDGQFQLIKVFPFHTVLGQLVVAKTLRNGKIELVGPENNQQLNEVITFIQQELGLTTIIIDGAASRLTPIASINDTGFFYVLHVDKKGIKKVIETLKLISLTSSFESISKLNKEQYNRALKINGALTFNKLSLISEETEAVIIRNLTSVFLDYKQLYELYEQKQIVVENKYRLKAFVAILNNIDADEFMQIYNQNKIKTELIINPYVN